MKIYYYSIYHQIKAWILIAGELYVCTTDDASPEHNGGRVYRVVDISK